jgi:hypothetical protein
MFFRSFYGSSEPGTPPHHDPIPSNPLRPHKRRRWRVAIFILALAAQFYPSALQTIIKSVEPLRRTTQKNAKYCSSRPATILFELRASDVLIDLLLTDSGASAMSTNQWAALTRSDQPYAAVRASSV